MMQRKTIALIGGGLAASGVIATCVILINPAPPPQGRAMMEAFDISMPEEMPAAPAGTEPAIPASSAIAVNVPQIAYRYALGFRLPARAIAPAQQAHVDLCARLGTRTCQLMSMQRGTDDSGAATANLELRVATAIAQRFSARLGQVVEHAGGRAIDTNVAAEDVSKQVVDTTARIRQREILVERLTTMLRNRAGKVGELVEAERSVAQAQEELDQAKGWLAELRGRVAFSSFKISYTPVTATDPTPRNFAARLADAVAQSANAVVAFFGGLLLAVVYLLPWLAIATPLAIFLWRRRRRHAIGEQERLAEGPAAA